MRLLSFLFVCNFLALVQSDCFFDAANSLRAYDKKLCGRLDPKKYLIKNGITLDDYKDRFETFKSNGTEFSCGYTRDWLMEMAFGMKNNYHELKNNLKSHGAAGYVNATGMKLIPLFDAQLGSRKRVFYEMQIVGPLDHVWLIEQLPDNQGYRVYQSYNGGYSLNAWMTVNVSKFNVLWDQKDIIYWQKVYDQASAFLQSKSLSIDKLDEFPASLNWMKPWLTNIKEYNKTMIVDNLVKAWKNFGAGKILSKEDFYNQYLNNLANMTEEIISLVNTTNPWTQKLHDQWINLFASPNPLCYPDAPFNTLTATLSQDYAVEVKVVQISDELEDTISDRAKILKESVDYEGALGICDLNNVPRPSKEDCFHSAATELKSYDKNLCGRLDPKKYLIASGIDFKEYKEEFEKFKSNGTEFSCGYTRDWLMEMAFGLKNNYEELKNNLKSHADAGYIDATGNKLRTLFDSKKNSVNRIFYEMQIVGPLDHVWLVEQLANGAGYRVYQSYNGGYSLNAWMEQNATKFNKLWASKDIIYWQKVYDQANDMLKTFGLSMDDLDKLPVSMAWMKPWLNYIKNYDKKQIVANLKKAWTNFGSGKTLSQQRFYEKYLLNLVYLTESIKPLVNTTKPWTQELHDIWINLFASPNPLCYPDAPFNTLNGKLSQDYKLEVKVVEMTSELEEGVPRRAMILKDSVKYNGSASICNMKKVARPPINDCFHSAADSLKSYDRELCGRLDPKYRLVAEGISLKKYEEFFNNFKSNGTTFSCGYTRDWLMEMAFGLKNNYDELKKRETSHAAAGYIDATGKKLRDLFDSKLDSRSRIFYEMQIVGPLDHVWLIEQLANGDGYRVYQSYNGAYSLEAWMEKDSSNFNKLWSDKEIIYWQTVFDQADNFLKSKGLSINNLDDFPKSLDWMKPWLINIKAYNQSGIIHNLERAWKEFGAGKTLSQADFYSKYIMVLSEMTEEIIPLVSTTKPWTQKLHDQWINLFASPNPLCYPGVPFNTLTATLSQDFKVEVKVTVMTPVLQFGINSRAKVLQDSVNHAGSIGCKLDVTASPSKTDCFFDTADGLKSYDRELCGRLDPKKELINEGISFEKFKEYFETFKSNGTEFSCGYTRDWLMELAQGMRNNYEELKANQKSHEAAGYKDYTGSKLKPLFDSKRGNSHRIFYEMQIVGPLDHVWLIEQLANGAGYRVYQSYNGAYSLEAWMEKDSTNFNKLWTEKEIIYWQKVYDQAAGFLKSKGLSIEELDKFPTSLNWMKPWLINIKTYNQSGIINNLHRAWQNFGAGKTLSQADFYAKYLLNLADVTEEIIPLVSTTKPWTQKLHDQWINLFASPNPLCYPDVPFNTLTATLPQDYKLEIRVVEMSKTMEDGISKRSEILKDSVGYKGKLGSCKTGDTDSSAKLLEVSFVSLIMSLFIMFF